LFNTEFNPILSVQSKYLQTDCGELKLKDHFRTLTLEEIWT